MMTVLEQSAEADGQGQSPPIGYTIVQESWRPGCRADAADYRACSKSNVSIQ